MRKRLKLAHLPTPLEQPAMLAAALRMDLWVKRDDMTGGPEAGNKVRKLEFLLAEALSLRCDTLITCGGIQSNHARATALFAARLGLRSLLFLRTTEPDLDPRHAPLTGNVLLDKLVGAEIRLITPADYRERTRLMNEAAKALSAEGRRGYVIPEGGSSGLGALGYVEAMAEVRRQLDLGLAGGRPFDAIVHACGSGGTAAGIVLGAHRHEIAPEVIAMAVCDDAETFRQTIARILSDARTLDPRLSGSATLVVDDHAKGPAYAVSTPEQRLRMIQVARSSGLILDPVYTGKAFSGLMDLASGPLAGKRVLFIHTGGLPGFLAEGQTFASELAGP